MTCKKVIGLPYQAPDSPPLPKSRLLQSRPFQVTGIDFTGALYVPIYSTCASTRTVHLEVVSDLSVGTFLLAFRRFAAQWSLPDIVISDNASTCESAASELKELFSSLTLTEALARQGVDWKFIPKRAPWYGGFWERLISLTKTVLKKVLRWASVNLMTLQPIMVEIEAVLDDRPLTPLLLDLEDGEPLAPVDGLRASLTWKYRVTKKGNPCSTTYTAFLAVLVTRILNFTKGLPQGQWYNWWHHRQSRRCGKSSQWWKESSEMGTRKDSLEA